MALSLAGTPLQRCFEAPLPELAHAHEEALREALLRLCARYLCLEKRGRSVCDPVANFHLRNGAILGCRLFC